MDLSKNAPDDIKTMVKDKRLANKLLDTLKHLLMLSKEEKQHYSKIKKFFQKRF